MPTPKRTHRSAHWVALHSSHPLPTTPHTYRPAWHTLSCSIISAPWGIQTAKPWQGSHPSHPCRSTHKVRTREAPLSTRHFNHVMSALQPMPAGNREPPPSTTIAFKSSADGVRLDTLMTDQPTDSPKHSAAAHSRGDSSHATPAGLSSRARGGSSTRSLRAAQQLPHRSPDRSSSSVPHDRLHCTIKG